MALIFSLIEFLLSLVVAFQFTPSGGTQFSENFLWVASLGINYHIGLDGISLLLVLLTTFLMPLIILSSWSREFKNPALFYSLVLLMQFALVGVFTALDGFLLRLSFLFTPLPEAC
jgi:NADH-quinone oxidoreductase subunit M